MTRIEDLFANDGIARRLGIELVDHDDRGVRLAMTVHDDHLGWHGRCHGGVLFTAADIAMSYLSNRFPEVAFASHASIEFLDGVEAGDLVMIDAVETVRSGRRAICDVTMTVDGRAVATFRGATSQTRQSAGQGKDR